MQTGAIHLALLGEGTAATFLGALRRFVARRGVPRSVLSDNAKVFKKANRELRQLYHNLQREETREDHKMRTIEWHFSAELAPWANALSERLIREFRRMDHLGTIASAKFIKKCTDKAEFDKYLESDPISCSNGDDIKSENPITCSGFDCSDIFDDKLATGVALPEAYVQLNLGNPDK
eukprot:TCALIF_13747-PA protein Name:"Protein of unknown function" AED:0.54 eAED:0.54 QI:0/0/0.25/0.5/1/1/4/0/177